jgi:hypothetical protein
MVRCLRGVLTVPLTRMRDWNRMQEVMDSLEFMMGKDTSR